MIATQLRTKVKFISDSHFDYFLAPQKIDNQHILCEGKIMREGTSYPYRHLDWAVASAVAYLEKGIDAFIVAYERDGSTTIWYEVDSI